MFKFPPHQHLNKHLTKWNRSLFHSKFLPKYDLVCNFSSFLAHLHQFFFYVFVFPFWKTKTKENRSLNVYCGQTDNNSAPLIFIYLFTDTLFQTWIYEVKHFKNKRGKNADRHIYCVYNR